MYSILYIYTLTYIVCIHYSFSTTWKYENRRGDICKQRSSCFLSRVSAA